MHYHIETSFPGCLPDSVLCCASLEEAKWAFQEERDMFLSGMTEEEEEESDIQHGEGYFSIGMSTTSIQRVDGDYQECDWKDG